MLTPDHRIRKNGVDRSLTAIDGGLCAPDGFRFSYVTKSISQGGKDAAPATELNPQGSKDASPADEQTLSLALLMADAPVPTASLFTEGDVQPYARSLYKRNASDGRLQASLFINGGVDLYSKNLSETQEDVLFGLVKETRLSAQRMCIFSSGKILFPYPKKEILSAIPPLYASLATPYERGEAATAFSNRYPAIEGAFSFALGDFPCKIGFVATKKGLSKGGTVLMTTDVNVSPACLKKALDSVAKDSFHLSGNLFSHHDDLVLLTSSCKAKNYVIAKEDGEYEKFLSALSAACYRICKEMQTLDGVSPIECSVLNARSKSQSRNAAKTLAEYLSVAKPTAEEFLTTVLSALGAAKCGISLTKAEISLYADGKWLCLMDGGTLMRCGDELIARLLVGEEVRLTVRLNDGNFSSSAWSCRR